MPFVAAKCTNCGGDLQIDNTKDAAICQYCGAPFVIEKAINLYNMTNNINANTVNIYSSNTDFDIRAGELIKYNGASAETIIPNNVTIIGRSAFENCIGLKSVIIPNSVRIIKERAFQNCTNLESIDIPDSVTSIEQYAFFGCSALNKVRLSENITGLYDNCFFKCINLTNIFIPEGVVELVNGVFSFCQELEEVILPKSLSLIGASVFADCVNLQKIIVPNFVKEIYEMAFYKTGIREIIIPENVERIRCQAFGYCKNLTSVILPKNTKLDGYDSWKEEYVGVFNDCQKLVNVSYSNGENWQSYSKYSPFAMTPFYLNICRVLIGNRQCIHCGNKIGILSSKCKHCSTPYSSYTIDQMEEELNNIQRNINKLSGGG